MAVEKAEQLVAKWAPRLGLANFRIHVLPLPGDKKSWAESDWSPLSEWGVVYILEDEDVRLTDRTREMTVIHELAHMFLDITVPGHKYERAEVERFCNRIARLVLNDWHTLEPDEAKALAKHSGKASKPGPGPMPTPGESLEGPPGVDRKLWLSLVLDSLPAAEREVLTALYFERISLRKLAKRMGEHVSSIRRTRDRAFRIMRERYEALERSFEQWPD